MEGPLAKSVAASGSEGCFGTITARLRRVVPSVSGGVPTFDVSLTIYETVHTNANARTNARFIDGFIGEAS